MKKKLSAIFLTLIFCLVFTAAAFAAVSHPYLVDNAGLLSSEEAQEVESALAEVSQKYDMDISILTTYETEGKSVSAYADDYYDYNEYGTGSDGSGALLVLDMGSRNWYIATKGEGIKAFTDYGIQEAGEKMLNDLSGGNYKDAFITFAETADRYIEQERAGTPVDVSSASEKTASPGSYLFKIVIALVFGFLLSLAVTNGMKKKMKSVAPQRAASAYVDQNGLSLTQSSDQYLYHHVAVVPIPKDSSSKGGSSTHFSSSGSIHGGGGGRF